ILARPKTLRASGGTWVLTAGWLLPFGLGSPTRNHLALVTLRILLRRSIAREAAISRVAKDDAATGLLCRHADLRTGAIGSRRRSAGSTPGLTSYAGLRSEIRALSSGR